MGVTSFFRVQSWGRLGPHSPDAPATPPPPAPQGVKEPPQRPLDPPPSTQGIGVPPHHPNVSGTPPPKLPLIPRQHSKVTGTHTPPSIQRLLGHPLSIPRSWDTHPTHPQHPKVPPPPQQQLSAIGCPPGWGVPGAAPPRPRSGGCHGGGGGSMGHPGGTDATRVSSPPAPVGTRTCCEVSGHVTTCPLPHTHVSRRALTHLLVDEAVEDADNEALGTGGGWAGTSRGGGAPR